MITTHPPGAAIEALDESIFTLVPPLVVRPLLPKQRELVPAIVLGVNVSAFLRPLPGATCKARTTAVHVAAHVEKLARDLR
jgi:hypothetical protein